MAASRRNPCALALMAVRLLALLSSRLAPVFVRGDDATVALDDSHHWVNVSEDAPVGSPLLHLEFTGAVPTCQLLTGEEKSVPFFLSPDGVLYTASVLDREDTDSYRLPVACRGASRTLPYQYAVIYVTVTDVADSFPLVEPSHQNSTATENGSLFPYLFAFPDNQSYPTYQVSVPENHTLHEPFFALPAHSPDLAPIVFSLVGGNSTGKFSMANSTGQLSVLSSLDYETRRSYRLIARVSSGGTSERANYSAVVVTVDDVPELPTFSQSSYEFAISESDLNLNRTVGCVFARDGQGESVTYSIEEAVSDLMVDSVTGVLTYSSALNSTHIVTARSSSAASLSATVAVTISVVTTGGTAPRFSERSYEVFVPEDVLVGTVVALLQACDNETDVVYQIVPSDQADLTINATSGEVSVSSPLDFERQSVYVLTLAISRSGSPLSFTTSCLRVTVEDVNEPPLFDSPSYEMYVSEDTPPGTRLLVVTAFDPDREDNGLVTFSAPSLPPFLSLSPGGDLVVTGDLDRESEPVINVTVIASDPGQLSHDVALTLHLSDVNDNRPSFDTELQVSVPENSSPETEVTRLIAVDNDMGTNAELSFSLVGPEYTRRVFYISPDGIVRTVRALDRETLPAYEILVRVRDGGTPGLSADATLTVTVSDRVERPPTFVRTNFTVTIRSPLLADTEVAVVEAVTQDLTAINYSLLNHDLFEIDPETGALFTLDDISDELYNVVVVATVPGYASSTTVTVEVTPSPGLLSTHTNIYVTSILYLVPDSLLLGTVGGDSHESLSVTTEDLASRSLFTIDPFSGKLRMSRAAPAGRYRLNVSTESGGDGSASVTVTVAWATNQTYDQAVFLSLDGLNRWQFVERFVDSLLDGVSMLVSSDLQIQLVGIIEQGGGVRVAIAALLPDLQTYLPRGKLLNRLAGIEEELSALLGWRVAAVDRSFCSDDPCDDFQLCSEELAVVGPATVAAATTTTVATVISLPLTTSRSCRCPRGYEAGDGCRTEVDECSPNPCHFGAECVDLVGDYRCICPDYASGKDCAVPCPSASCLFCDPSPCLNGGTCHDDGAGPVCECPEGFPGPFCQETSLHFHLGAYAAHPPLGSRWQLKLTVFFATVSPSGLLLYAGSYGGNGDTLSIELVAGQVAVAVALGGDKGSFHGQTAAYYPLNDGTWHNVTVLLENQVVNVSVDDCSTDAVVVRNGGELCVFSIALKSGSDRPLEVTSEVFLGGVPSSSPPYLALPFLDTYSGCLGWLTIDDTLTDMNSLRRSSGVSRGCPPLEIPKCNQGCLTLWDGCRCEGGYDTGAPITLEGESNVTLTPVSDEEASFQLMQFSVDVRTFDIFSVIAWLGPATIELQYGSVVFRAPGIVLTADAGIHDDLWHTLSLSLSVNGSVLVVDDGRANVSSSSTANLNLSDITIGMYRGDNDESVGYVGCLKNITINGDAVPLPDYPGGISGEFDVALATNSSGCGVGTPCAPSLTCPANSFCRSQWKEGRCVCRSGYAPQGEICFFPCDAEPCQNGGVCHSTPTNINLITCVCGTQGVGIYCEIGLFPCDTGFHRQSTMEACKLCLCDAGGVTTSFCNEQTGACHCKDDEPRYSDAEGDLGCLPCGCHPEGSVSELCDQAGRCTCRENVVGRACDRCAPGYAGLDESGCYEATVLHGSFVLDNVPFTSDFWNVDSSLSSQLAEKLAQECNKAIGGFGLPGFQEFSVISFSDTISNIATHVSYEVTAYVKDAQSRPSLSLLAAVMQVIVQRGRTGVFTTDMSSHQPDLTCSGDPCLNGVCEEVFNVTSSSSPSFVCTGCPQGTSVEGVICQTPASCSLSGPDSDKDGVPDACDGCPYLFNPYQGSLTSCLAMVGSCEAELSSNAGVLWSETLPGTTDQKPCPDPFTGVARRTCNGSGQWERPNLAGCLSPTGQFLEDMLQELQSNDVTLDRDALESYSRQLLSLVTTPSLTGADLLVATSVLEELLIRGAPVIDRHVVILLVTVAGELAGGGRADQWLALPVAAAASELVAAAEMLGVVATRVAEVGGGPVEEGTDGASLYVARFSPGQFPGISLIKESIDGNESSVDIIPETGNVTNVSVVYLPYLALSLPTPSLDLLPGSPVWSIQLEGVDDTPLSPPVINITFPHVELKILSNDSVLCVVWERNGEEDGAWVSEGCQLLDVSATHSTCGCTHLSAFTLLVNSSALVAVPEEVIVYHPTVFNYLVLSLFVLVMVITLIALFINICKKRKWSTLSLLVQLVIALLLLNLFFVVGIDRVENSSLCVVMGVALHYLVLTALSWLVALIVYVGLAARLGDDDGDGWSKWPSLLTSLIAWALPVVIITAGLLVVGLTEPSLSSAYGYPSYCWIVPDLSPVLLVPAGLLFIVGVCALLVNFLSFALCTPDHENRKEMRFHLSVLCCAFVLFSVAWSLSTAAIYASDDSWRLALDSSFAATNLLLAVAIATAFIAMPAIVECLQRHVRFATRIEKSLYNIRRASINSYRGRVERRSFVDDYGQEPEYQAVDHVSPHGRIGVVCNGGGDLVCAENYELEDWIAGSVEQPTMTEMAEDWEREYVYSSSSQPSNHPPNSAAAAAAAHCRQGEPATHQLRTEEGRGGQPVASFHGDGCRGGGCRGDGSQERVELVAGRDGAFITSESPLAGDGGGVAAPTPGGGTPAAAPTDEDPIDSEDMVPIEGAREPEALWYACGSPPSLSNLTPDPFTTAFAARSRHHHGNDAGLRVVNDFDDDDDDVSSQIIDELYQQTRGRPDVCQGEELPPQPTISVNDTTAAEDSTPWYKTVSELTNGHDIQPYAAVPLDAVVAAVAAAGTPPPGLLPGHVVEPTYAEIPSQPVPPHRSAGHRCSAQPLHQGRHADRGLAISSSLSSSEPRCNATPSSHVAPRRDAGVTSTHHPLATRTNHASTVVHPVPSPGANHSRLEQRRSSHGNFASLGNMARNHTNIRQYGVSQTTESLV